MDYYRILADDAQCADRWFLGEPVTDGGEVLDAREFRYGRPYSGAVPRLVPVLRAGLPVAFNLAAFDMPVVSSEIGDAIERIRAADIQRFPVAVAPGGDSYEILNVIAQERCLDEARSRARKWTLEDGRPDRLGQYREISRLVIDPARAGGRHLLRIWGSRVELIVSREVKEQLASVTNLGVVFMPVSAIEA